MCTVRGYWVTRRDLGSDEESPPLRMLSCGKTDIGLRRKNNEDSCVVRPDLAVFAVADGIGGAAGGEIASRILTETVEEIFSRDEPRSDEETIRMVQQVFSEGNQRILDHAGRNVHHRGMGSTGVLVAFSNSTYTAGHIGDSRIYLFRDGKLRQITKDHSLVQDQIDKGLVTPEQARTHRMKHVVLRALGAQPSVELDLIRGSVQPGDVFLLCSDGLTDMVEDAAIEEALVRLRNVCETVDELVEAAKSAGGHDNITVVLCQLLSP